MFTFPRLLGLAMLLGKAYNFGETWLMEEGMFPLSLMPKGWLKHGLGGGMGAATLVHVAPY